VRVVALFVAVALDVPALPYPDCFVARPFDAPLFDAPLLEAPVFDALLFEAPDFEALLFDVPLFEPLLFEALRFDALLFDAAPFLPGARGALVLVFGSVPVCAAEPRFVVDPRVFVAGPCAFFAGLCRPRWAATGAPAAGSCI
jgi:hypothetical protein